MMKHWSFIAYIGSSLTLVANGYGLDTQPVRATQEDGLVIEALIREMVRGDRNLISYSAKRPQFVLGAREPRFARLTNLRKQLPFWDVLTQTETYQNAVQRNMDPVLGTKRRLSYENLTFDSMHIFVDDLRNAALGNLGPSNKLSFREKYPNASGWLQVYLPGYSRDGSKAFVLGEMGPSARGAFFSAFLEKRYGYWKVVWIKPQYVA